MAGRITTLSNRLVMTVLAIHAILLPILFFALSAVVRQNMSDAFIDHARVQGRLIADSLELDGNQDDDALVAHLDSALLGGRIVYTSLERGDSELSSSLMAPSESEQFDEDFEFGDHGDGVYYLSLPIVTAKSMAILRLGFDETPTEAYLAQVQRSIIIVLIAYLSIVVFASILISRTMTRPLRWLQSASRSIALGDYEKQLQTDSKLTEIHELAQDLEKMRSNLVAVNARLQHSQRLQSLGTLAGGVAHEFNNVLQPLLLYADLAIEELPPDNPAFEKIERVRELASRARGLSHQILTFGRVGDEASVKQYDIAPVIEEAIAMIRALLPATIELQTSIQRGCGEVNGNPAQIQQLVVNLCNNALQALTDRGGQIRVSLKATDVGDQMAAAHPHLEIGKYVLLSVADNGAGMTPETIERVFEPFFTTRDVGQGTGLGLSVVHGIVRLHHGEIILTSEPGEGTVFDIYLPRAGWA
jgi:signal transduction histidine kinase